MPQFVVQKAFEGPMARVFQPGELVEAEGWRNLDRLLTTRYLRPATADEIASAEPTDPVFLPRKAQKPRVRQVAVR